MRGTGALFWLIFWSLLTLTLAGAGILARRRNSQFAPPPVPPASSAGSGRTGVLLSRSCQIVVKGRGARPLRTSGLSGELWLMADGLLRVHSGLASTIEHSYSAATVEPGNRDTAHMDDEFIGTVLNRDPKHNAWVTRAEIRRARLVQKQTVTRLELHLGDGASIRFDMPLLDRAFEPLETGLRQWLGAGLVVAAKWGARHSSNGLEFRQPSLEPLVALCLGSFCGLLAIVLANVRWMPGTDQLVMGWLVIAFFAYMAVSCVIQARSYAKEGRFTAKGLELTRYFSVRPIRASWSDVARIHYVERRIGYTTQNMALIRLFLKDSRVRLVFASRMEGFDELVAEVKLRSTGAEVQNPTRLQKATYFLS